MDQKIVFKNLLLPLPAEVDPLALLLREVPVGQDRDQFRKWHSGRGLGAHFRSEETAEQRREPIAADELGVHLGQI
jgi:hypothetical protein